MSNKYVIGMEFFLVYWLVLIVGYVDKVKVKYCLKDGVLWMILLYGIGLGYDWGLRINKIK